MVLEGTDNQCGPANGGVTERLLQIIMEGNKIYSHKYNQYYIPVGLIMPFLFHGMKTELKNIALK